jgi:hypothetical protein
MTKSVKRELSEEQDYILASPARDKISPPRAASFTADDSAVSEDSSIAGDECHLGSNPTLAHQPSNHVHNQLPSANLGDDRQDDSEIDPEEVASSTGDSSQCSSKPTGKKRKLSDTRSALVIYENNGVEEQRRLNETQLYQAFLASSTASRQLSMARHTPIISQ